MDLLDGLVVGLGLEVVGLERGVLVPRVQAAAEDGFGAVEL